MSILACTSIARSFTHHAGTVHAIHNVELSLPKGTFTALMGPSGSGKTTLLHTCAGMLRPTTGRVLWDGQPVYDLPPHRRAALRARFVGMVFQQFHLMPYLSVRQNILLPCVAHQCPAPRADQLMQQLAIDHRATHRPTELSSGEQQRVALARALLHQPALLLADEPTGNLDNDNAAIVLAALTSFARTGGTVLMVTHDRSAALAADSTLHIANGTILHQPEPAP